jgi:hypothetical protein
MNPKQEGHVRSEVVGTNLVSDTGKRPVFWRSSLYEEPMWVSLAWIIGPALCAGIAIYFVVA